MLGRRLNYEQALDKLIGSGEIEIRLGELLQRQAIRTGMYHRCDGLSLRLIYAGELLYHLRNLVPAFGEELAYRGQESWIAQTEA